MRTIKSLEALLAEMIRIEAGCICVDDDLKKLPIPHEPYPIYTIDPVTSGESYSIHYKASTGVVYYTGRDFDIKDLLETLVIMFNTHCDNKHLLNERSFGGSPIAIIKNTEQVLDITIIKYQKKSRNNTKKINVLDKTSRLLIYHEDNDVPPYYSTSAIFTWVFMPIISALKFGKDPLNIAIVNATIAGVIYDTDELILEGPIVRLTIDNINIPRLADTPNLRYYLKSPYYDVCINLNDNSLSLIPSRMYKRVDTLKLPVEIWDPSHFDKPYQCLNCDLPIGDTVIIIRDSKYIKKMIKNLSYRYEVSYTGPILNDHKEASLLCVYCWSSYGSSYALNEELDAKITQSVIPYTQAEVAKSCFNYKHLAPILEGEVSIIDNIPGAFKVKTKDSGLYNGETIILTSELFGNYPELINYDLMDLKLRIINNLRIIEINKEEKVENPDIAIQDNEVKNDTNCTDSSSDEENTMRRNTMHRNTMRRNTMRRNAMLHTDSDAKNAVDSDAKNAVDSDDDFIEQMYTYMCIEDIKL